MNFKKIIGVFWFLTFGFTLNILAQDIEKPNNKSLLIMGTDTFTMKEPFIEGSHFNHSKLKYNAI